MAKKKKKRSKKKKETGKKFVCPFCKRDFKSKAGLINHKKVCRKKNKKLKKKKKPQRRKTREIKKIKVQVIGIGGGGNSIVFEIAQRVKKASFVAANTDLKTLKKLSRRVKKFPFGKELTGGLGTGMDPELGEEAAKQSKEKIKKLLEGQDLVILIACLGGGLGSGATPVFAKTSRDLGNITYGIFTLPFRFEGKKKIEIARESLKKSRRYLDAFSVIPNERIFKIIDRSAPLKKALSSTNRRLADSLQSLIKIIYKPGLINIDFADLKTIFRQRGKLAYLNSVVIKKEKEKEKKSPNIVKKVISSPLYPYGIEGAKGVLFNISGQKKLSLAQVDYISNTISEKVYKNAKIIFGISRAKRGSEIRVSLLATGCKPSSVLQKTKKKSRKTRKKKRKKKKKDHKKIKIRGSPPKKRSSKKEEEKTKIRVRKNALQVKKEREEEEEEIISKEKLWETPAFLRKKMNQEN